jgi:hypothetical protein
MTAFSSEFGLKIWAKNKKKSAIVDLRVKGVDMIITTRVLVLHLDETFYGIRGHREIVLGVYDDGMSYETNKEEAN